MIDPTQLIESIARYAVREHPDRPWPQKSGDIPVVPIITRHTPLLAVLWSEVDNEEEDTDLDSGSGTSRVVFSLTAVSQIRKNVARMASHLASAVSFNSDLIGSFAEDADTVNIPSYTVEYFDSETNGDIQERPTPRITASPALASIPRQFRTDDVWLYSCRVEGRSIMYDPSLDAWKGTVTFISDMSEVPPEAF